MDTQRIAALPMYDFPELESDHEALWAHMARGLVEAGIPNVPERLTRNLGHFDLWRHPNLLLAQGCEYPLATECTGAVRLVATPRYTAQGCDGGLYRSAIVVREGEAARSLADMRGRRCAVNERNSNSGMNLLRAAVAPLAGGGRFFGSVQFSGSHRRSLELVADGLADLAAIDCVTLAHLQRFVPNRAASLRILSWTEASPSLPFVTSSATDDATLRTLRSALAAAIEEPSLAPARERLLIEGFDFEPGDSFTEVLRLARLAAELRYPTLL